jgi:hypothetical protein
MSIVVMAPNIQKSLTPLHMRNYSLPYKLAEKCCINHPLHLINV